MTIKAQTLNSLSARLNQETDSISATNSVMVRVTERERETIRYGPSVQKVNKTAMDGVLSNLERVLVLRVLSASMAAWALKGTEMIGG
jgi:hypothetical protein